MITSSIIRLHAQFVEGRQEGLVLLGGRESSGEIQSNVRGWP